MRVLPPLLLVRHAEAEHHVQAITGGWSDTNLTELGRQQSELLAERLRNELAGANLHLGSSNLQRACQTAEILGAGLLQTPEVYSALTDLNNGVAAGKTHAEAKAIALPPTEPLLDWQPYPQAESWRQFYHRVAGFMEEFTTRQQGPALLVSHAAVIHVIVSWWLGMDPAARTHFGIAPASLTVLNTSRWRERSLERLNDTAHLYCAGIPDPIHL
jgi:broad specificity phosphatase PhoE